MIIAHNDDYKIFTNLLSASVSQLQKESRSLRR